MRLYRVIVPVGDIEEAAAWYGHVLGFAGERVSDGRHYFDCGGTILACFDPRADGHDEDAAPLPNYIYLSVDDLEGVRGRLGDAVTNDIAERPWGERSLYAKDPWGSGLCFVEAGTEFTGGAV